MERSYSDTLMAELHGWSRLEQTFAQTFGSDSLRDRDYLKMKLSEYDRLYHFYAAGTLSRDEKAMTRMLRYQSRKLERALFPGLASRLLRRAVRQLIRAVSGDDEAAIARNFSMTENTVWQSPEKMQATGQRKRHGYDLGRRRPGPGKGKRQGL